MSDKVYTSNFTGSQIDEAVGKVINNEIGGEAIKEGSIPMSALADDVKDKIENAGAGSGGADWNATREESGYIENRTHYYANSIKFRYDSYNDLYITDYISGDDGKIYIEDVIDLNRKYEIPIINTSEDGQSGQSGQSGYDWSDALNIDFWDVSEEYYGVFSVGYDIDNNRVVAIYNANEADVDYDLRIERMNVFNVVQINSEFIPNTVLKTTPQTLSDTDKNQALANLGIDPVVWKYICNPCIAEVGKNVPAELLVMDDGSPTLIMGKPSMFKVKYEGNIYNVTFVSHQSLEFIKDGVTLYMITDGSTFNGISDMP